MACAFEDAGVAEERVREVCGHEQGVGFEGELDRVEFRADLAAGLGLVDRGTDHVHPSDHELGDAVAHGAGPDVHLGGGGDEEAAARKDAALDMREEGVAERQHAGCAGDTACAGSMTSCPKTSFAVAIVASWSSSLDRKWA